VPVTIPSGALASLAMYPFPSLRAATDELWSVIRGHLDAGPDRLEWEIGVPEVWRHPALFLAQTCGWPLVTELLDAVVVVGVFDYDVPGAEHGTYQSVIVSPHDVALDVLRSQAGVVAAVNGADSLSGWVSLQHVWGSAPNRVLTTGAHLESVRALAQGRADVASVDAVSWDHFGRIEPVLVEGLHVIGAGPRVPCLPFVTARRHSALVPALRAAFAAAVADPAASDACAALRVRGFVPLDLADYLPLRSLLG
jgi:ABC-type phosphate/phosphonate transport system substrate-binding protein